MTDTPIEIQTGEAPLAAVVVLHGLGADGTDFVPIAHELDLSGVGPVRFVFPHAPVRPVTLNGGYRMRAWFDVFPPEGGRRREDEAGLRAAREQVDALLRRERERGIPPSRIVLAGFSQGCAMALLTGLRHDERLAGIAGLSGYLPLASTTAAERHPANRDTPVFLAHGQHDPVVVIDRGLASRDALRSIGQPVDWHLYPIEHTVCAEELRDLEAWLCQCLA